MVVPYARLRQDWQAVVREIAEFADLELSPELLAAVKEQSREQQEYAPTHHNRRLEGFGLTAEQIRADLPFLFEGDALTTARDHEARSGLTQ